MGATADITVTAPDTYSSPSATARTADLQQLIAQGLAPHTQTIDRQGDYPSSFMHSLGQLGGYSQHLASNGHAFYAAVDTMAQVSRECMSTGFCVWCQDALGWYLENSDESAVREHWLPQFASGARLGGTGLSNAMKHLAGIEPLKVRLTRVAGGYIANGTLPWVSNLGPEHVFAAVFELAGSERRVMALTECHQPGFALRACPEFIALEGSGTYACHFRDSFIPDANVISHDVAQLIPRIRSGFVLLQMGMGLGVVQACIDIMYATRETHHHVNGFLDEQPEALEEELNDARRATRLLGSEVAGDHSDTLFADVLQLREGSSHLALRAAQGAMLHAGARGYLADAPAQRKLREAYFVAIVTPAIKHIRKELARLEAA